MARFVVMTLSSGGVIGINPDWVARVDEEVDRGTVTLGAVSRIWFGVPLHADASEHGQDSAVVLGDVYDTIKMLDEDDQEEQD